MACNDKCHSYPDCVKFAFKKYYACYLYNSLCTEALMIYSSSDEVES